MSQEKDVSKTRLKPWNNLIKRLKNRFFPVKYNRYVARNVRQEMALFGGLESIGPDTKKRIFPALLHSEVLLANAKDSRNHPSIPLVFLIVIPALIITFGTPFFVMKFWGFSFESSTWLITKIGFYFLYLLGICIVLGLVSVILNAKSVAIQYSVLILFTIISILVLAWFYLTKESVQTGILSIEIISVFSFWLLYFAYILIFVMPLVFLIDFIAEYKLRYHPEAVVAGSLLKILTRVEFSPKLWKEMEFKQEICLELETIAVELQKFSNRMETRDLETNIWFKKHIAEVAQSFRVKKKLILSPIPQSRQELINGISQSLVSVVQGNWGNLKTENLQTFKEESRLWIKRIPEFVKSIFVSAIPLIVLYLLQFTPLKFEEPYWSYAKIGGIVWFAISLMIMLDPLYNTKLTALKNIKGLFPFGEKEK